jgi:hypothetical protein
MSFASSYQNGAMSEVHWNDIGCKRPEVVVECQFPTAGIPMCSSYIGLYQMQLRCESLLKVSK